MQRRNYKTSCSLYSNLAGMYTKKGPVTIRSQLKNERGDYLLLKQDLIHGPLKLKASVLLLNYADPFLSSKSRQNPHVIINQSV